MPTTTVVQRTIDAPTARVFAAVSEPATLPEVIPDIERVEFLTEQRSGVGTRFRETRLMNGKPTETELEITALEPNQRVRMVADSHGTVWDSVFTVRRVGEKTELRIAMEARAHELLPKLLNPLFKGLYRKGLDRHVDAVKTYCEAKR